MNATRTVLSMILTILAASGTLADGAEETRRQPPRRLTGPDPSEFKIDKLKDLCLDAALVKGGRAILSGSSRIGGPPRPAAVGGKLAGKSGLANYHRAGRAVPEGAFQTETEHSSRTGGSGTRPHGGLPSPIPVGIVVGVGLVQV